MDNSIMNLNACPHWYPINDFKSIDEFERFEKYIENQINNGNLEEICVKELYASPNLKERWFKCKICHHNWRLVYPDFPFRGLWAPIDN